MRSLFILGTVSGWRIRFTHVKLAHQKATAKFPFESFGVVLTREVPSNATAHGTVELLREHARRNDCSHKQKS